MESNSETNLEKINRKLYERGSRVRADVRTQLETRTSRESIPEWQGAPTPETIVEMSTQKKTLFVHKVLYASIAFFGVAIGVAVYFFVSGSNVYSNQNIDVTVTGPVAIEGGKELNLQVVIANRNAVALESADFIIEYPDGTKKADKPGEDLIRERQYIGDIKSGELVKKSVRAILYGEENAQKTITFTLEYRAPGSNQIFVKEKAYTLVISSSPVGMIVDMPKEITSNKEVVVKITVSPNATTPVRGVLLGVQYPSGFTFKSSEPSPISKTNIWRLGDLSPQQVRIVTIRGILEGQDDDVKSFKISTGLPSASNEDAIGTVYSSLFKTITIARPSIVASMNINDSTSGDAVAQSGETARVKIDWTNNIADTLSDMKAVVTLRGVMLDKESVNAMRGGFYQSTTNEITWDASMIDELKTVEPGAMGTFDFSFSSIPTTRADYPVGKNPVIDLEAVVSGTRFVPGSQAEKVETRITRRIKIASELQLSARSVYSTGPFKNTGPIPPVAEKPTSYTVVWSLKNTSSDMYDATVEASLPSYVQWVGATYPSEESVVYSQSTGKVTWKIGDVRAGTGVTSATREAAFQVLVTPSIAQVRTYPVILQPSVFVGTDSFAKTSVRAESSALTTDTQTDPAYKTGDGQVVR